MQVDNTHIPEDADEIITAAFNLAEQGTLDLIQLMSVAERLKASGQKGSAIDLYRLWLEHSASPLAFAAYFNLGVALASDGQYLEAEQMYRKALEQNPGLIQARLNLGNSLEQKGEKTEALEQWRIALEEKNIASPENRPLQLHALNNLGRLLEMEKNYKESLEMLEKSFAIDPTQRDVLLHLVHLTQKICRWPIYNPPKGITKAEMVLGTSPLAMVAAFDDPALQLSIAKNFVEYKYTPSTVTLAPDGGYKHEKIRVGYLSSDFCLHAVSLLTVQLFELHNREQFEVYGFCWSREDGTALRDRVVKAMDHYIRIDSFNDRDAAECIRSNEIDILIDLQGLTSGARPQILSYRPAPIQMTYLGFTGTTALPWIDYVIADKYLIPDELAPHFTEKPLYLPNCFQVSDCKREVGVKPTRAENNLPEDAFVFCSFNNNYKFTPDLFAVWMRILKSVPNSVLWLLADNEWARENMCRAAKKHGIKSDRLIFASRAAPPNYLARYQLADLFLDTFPFNGGTTANDALFMGLPLLTCSGKTFASRMAGSLLYNLGLPELIANNFKEYEEKAVKFAKKNGEIDKVKKKLSENKQTSPVFDMPGVVRDMEAAFERVLQEKQRPLTIPKQLENITAGPAQEIHDSNVRMPIPYFSIVIATHNRPLLLERSIASVRNQTFKNFELIVVSDSAETATFQTAGRHLGEKDIFIKRKGIPGPAQSRNMGIDHATGQYLIFLDDDDSIDPGYLEKLHAECEKNRGTVLYCNFHLNQEDRQTAPITTLSENYIDIGAHPQINLHIKNYIPNNALVYPRICIEQKRFDTHLKLNEDWDFLLNVLEECDLKHIDISGPRVHKDDPKRLNRRGTQSHQYMVIDLIHVYRRWPAKTDEIKSRRLQLLQNAGTNVPIEWL